jgi:hypothetical protein
MMYPKEEILRRLKMVSWDITYSPEQLYDLLMGKVDRINSFSRNQLYAKIVKGFYWHQVRHIIPEEKLREALSEDVISGLFPRDLREKYRYVRSLL